MLPANEEQVDCDGLRFESDQAISLSIGLFLRALAGFSAHWLYALAVIFLCLRLKPNDASSVTLVFGIGAESLISGGGDARFLAYCRNGPIDPLAQARVFAIQSRQPIVSTDPDHVRYHRFPLFAALRWHGLGPFAWLRSLAGHIAALVSFGWTVVRCPSAIILGRDAAYHTAATALNRIAGIQAVVLTNSNCSAQALWMWALPERHYRTHMAWYSENSAPIIYSDDPVDTPLPIFRFINVDEMWVWTSRSQEFFERLGCGAIYHVVGPILWCLPEVLEMPNRNEIRIAVFDITPKCDAAAMLEGLINNYYSAANMTRFIEDIVCACAELERAIKMPVRILLKHKRTHRYFHDAGYISLIERISGPGQAVQLVPLDINPYSFISSCDLTLVAPYSSPAHVATNLGRPAIYYDPTATIQSAAIEHPLLKCVAGRENLVRVLLRFFGVERRSLVRNTHELF